MRFKMLINLTLLTVLFVVLVGCAFPKNEDIDAVINAYNKEESFERRVALLKGMLKKVSNPGDKEDDQVSSYATASLAALYKENNDEAILVAVDETRIDAGFANFVCMFYKSIAGEQGFIKRYSTVKNIASIERCVGISFSPEEIKSLIERENN